MSGDPETDQSLSERIAALRARQAARTSAGRTPEAASGWAMGGRMAADMVAGVIVGLLIGWAIDRFAGTSPWGLVICLLLGFAAGLMNVIRTAQSMGQQPGQTKDKPPAGGKD